MSDRKRSATPSLAQGQMKSNKRRKQEYLGTLKKAQQQLIALQRDLQEQQQKVQEQNEKNLILAGLIYVQERTNAIYHKHKRWLAAGGPTAEELKQKQQLEVELQVGGCHWCLYALETATWEQLQTALSYDTAQWNDYLNKYFQKLIFLSELTKRPPELQAQLLQANGISLAPQLPLVCNYKGLLDTLTPAWAAVFETLQTEGCLASLALLHGNMALVDAASRNAATGEQCLPPPTIWARLAQRMRFSRLQKLHFKLALENFGRQTRAAAANGLSVLQETPSYAFLLACEDIAAQQQPPEGPPGPAAAAAAAAATGCEIAGVANGCPTADLGSNGRQSQQPQQQQRLTPEATAAMPVPSQPPAAAPGDSGGSALGDGPAAAEAGAAAAADVEMAPAGPCVKLQRTRAVYQRQVVALILFLSDTLSPEQGLIMNRGSYPFWPSPGQICEAALQLPDDDQQAVIAPWQDADEVVPDSIELLLSQRRHTMAETHDSLMPSLMKLRL